VVTQRHPARPENGYSDSPSRWHIHQPCFPILSKAGARAAIICWWRQHDRRRQHANGSGHQTNLPSAHQRRQSRMPKPETSASWFVCTDHILMPEPEVVPHALHRAQATPSGNLAATCPT